jgi:hypothetical protein
VVQLAEWQRENEYEHHLGLIQLQLRGILYNLGKLVHYKDNLLKF